MIFALINLILLSFVVTSPRTSVMLMLTSLIPNSSRSVEVCSFLGLVHRHTIGGLGWLKFLGHKCLASDCCSNRSCSFEFCCYISTNLCRVDATLLDPGFFQVC